MPVLSLDFPHCLSLILPYLALPSHTSSLPWRSWHVGTRITSHREGWYLFHLSVAKDPFHPSSSETEGKGHTQWMTTAQLRLLRIFTLQLIPYTIQQLHIALLGILLQRRDKRPRHGPRRLARNLRVLAGLRIFTARPHNHIGGTRLGLFVPLVGGVAGGCFFEEAHGGGGHASHVAAGVGGDDAEEALAGFFGKVGFFEDALGGVDVGEVESRSGVAGIEDGGEADPGLEGADHYAVHLVVDDVAGYTEVDGIDDFIVAVFFVTVKVFSLTAVT